MRARSDRINTFGFLANRDLKRELGRFDAMILYQEVMMREYYVSQKKSALDEDSYAKQCAGFHQIPLSHIPFNKVMSHYHQAFLIYPLACFEVFLDGFIKNWWPTPILNITLQKYRNRVNAYYVEKTILNII